MGTYELFSSPEGFRWRFLSATGDVLCLSAEAYPTREACLSDIERMKGSWSASVHELVDHLDRGVVRGPGK